MRDRPVVATPLAARNTAHSRRSSQPLRRESITRRTPGGIVELNLTRRPCLARIGVSLALAPASPRYTRRSTTHTASAPSDHRGSLETTPSHCARGADPRCHRSLQGPKPGVFLVGNKAQRSEPFRQGIGPVSGPVAKSSGTARRFRRECAVFRAASGVAAVATPH